MNFSTDIKFLKGVGEVRAEAFYKASVTTVGTLLRYYPRTYEDWSKVVPIREAPFEETCCIKALVCETPSKVRIPGGKLIFKSSATDGAGIVGLTFFNNKYITSMLVEGEEYFFYGKISVNKYGCKEMVSPMFQKVESQAGIKPVYSQTAKLNTRFIGKCVKTALDNIELIPDYLDENIINRFSLCSLDFAIRNIHFPKDYNSLEKARTRLIFDELFILQLGLLSIKSRTNSLITNCIIDNDYTQDFASLLPFAMTDAQTRAVIEAIKDMNKPEPMCRLLQGDVGSGKTAVAASLVYTVIKNGFQSALMAPTEVLAEQHFRTFTKLFNNTGINVALLTGSMKSSEKKAVKQSLANGDIDFVIGTHSLIQEDVEFSKLGFVVTDEQHRFGVAQRASFASKGENPHVYVMSATPIPRTLAMIMYGDLNVSVLDELPPGRQKIETFTVTSEYHNRIYNFIKKHLDKGFQGYIVCPLVEEGETELMSAQEYYKILSSSEFKNYKLGLLHGKMKPSEKDKVMRAFVNGEIQLLISTVVIEVGVDVPNAVVMVIENAERFGLSQLHQLRGRIGRGSNKSTCILISDAQNEESQKRFDIMCETNDGFKIANADLELRGPGDFFGKRQHGLPELRLANILNDTEMLMKTQSVASEIILSDKQLTLPKHKKLKKQVDKLFCGHILN